MCDMQKGISNIRKRSRAIHLKRLPVTWTKNARGPSVRCPTCGKTIRGAYHTDSATHNDWLTTHFIEFYLYTCKCGFNQETVIDWHCPICEKEFGKNSKERVAFT